MDTLGAAKIVERLEHHGAAHGARFTPAPILVEMAKSGGVFYGDGAVQPPKPAARPKAKAKAKPEKNDAVPKRKSA